MHAFDSLDLLMDAVEVSFQDSDEDSPQDASKDSFYDTGSNSFSSIIVKQRLLRQTRNKIT